MKLFLAIVFSVSVALAGQGDKPQFKKTKVGAVDMKAPVTRSEAAAVFSKARKSIISARVAQISPKSSIAAGNAPVTREEVIAEMTKIFEASKKSIKFMPSPVTYNPGVFRIGSGSKAALSNLVSWGFVGSVSPLATGPKPNLTVAQFGDALGFFLARMSDITHMPSTRWSPYLMPNDREP